MKLKDKLLIWRLESSISSSKYFVPFQVLGMLHPTKSENLSTSAKQSCQCFCSAYFSTPHTEIKVYDAPVPTNIFMFLGRCFYHVFASSISYIEKIFSFSMICTNWCSGRWVSSKTESNPWKISILWGALFFERSSLLLYF